MQRSFHSLYIAQYVIEDHTNYYLIIIKSKGEKSNASREYNTLISTEHHATGTSIERTAAAG